MPNTCGSLRRHTTRPLKAAGAIIKVIEDSLNYLLNRHNLQRSSLATLAGCQTFCACTQRSLRRGLVVISISALLMSRVDGAETSLSETNLIPENLKLWTESM